MQGSETPIVFFSFAATGLDYQKSEHADEWYLKASRTISKFILDARRLNVALTRQKFGLIIVGNMTTLERVMNSGKDNLAQIKALRKVFEFFKSKNHVFTLSEAWFPNCDAEFKAKVVNKSLDEQLAEIDASGRDGGDRGSKGGRRNSQRNRNGGPEDANWRNNRGGRGSRGDGGGYGGRGRGRDRE